MGKWAIECEADATSDDTRRWWLHKAAPHRDKGNQMFDWFPAPLPYLLEQRIRKLMSRAVHILDEAGGRDLSQYKLFDTQEAADQFLIEWIFKKRKMPKKGAWPVYVEDAS